MSKGQNQAQTQARRYLDTEHALAKRTKWAHRITLMLCAALVVCFGLALFVAPHKDYSPEEKRVLADLPELSLDALFQGELMRELSDFCADQFPLRSLFVRAKAGMELLLGKGQNNDVMLGKQGYLFSLPQDTKSSREQLRGNVQAVSLLAGAMQKEQIPFCFAVVPRALDVMQDYLPKTYDTRSLRSLWDEMRAAASENALDVISLTEPLRAQTRAGEAVWYKTDHHWTTLGAYYAYVALGEALGYTPHPISDFEQVTVCDDFYGTAYAAGGMHWLSGDRITLFRFEGDEQRQTNIVQGGNVIKTLSGLYDMDALQTQDQYELFLGGTNTRIEVVPRTGEDLPTLVVIKDSFSQSLAPFLSRHYHLILIDPRTYKALDGSLIQAVLKEQPDYVLVLCGLQTLCEPGALKTLEIPN